MIPIEYLRECFELDAENGRLFWKERPRQHFRTEHGWKIFNATHPKKEALRNRTKDGYLHGSVRYNGVAIDMLAHRVIFALVFGRYPEHCIDHVNGNPSDNRLMNLREATFSQNRYNSRGRQRSLTQVKGVTKRRGGYRASIYLSGRNVHLGDFPTIDIAAAAYAAAAKQHFGEFARID
jgi:hypothetical protein